ncbi:hypothetical protein GJ629_13415, partial [Halapricum sp. CBA1109]|uniref:N-acetylmuramoyl-L-alanine amidase n=1 Tax=Halapricum sp. CBA1109 TaxID=2668068 RepID=UPI0012FADCEF|nr:hypothetical protein [Halapricum sp. CBA1109]
MGRAPHDRGRRDAGIATFQNPGSNVSSHYVVGFDGTITKMVDPKDVAYTNGNGPYNDTSINIEMAGRAGQTDFPSAQISAVADLTRWLCDTYSIPKRHPEYDIAPCSAYGGAGGLIGHEQIPAPDNCNRVTGGKVDPGPTWPWDRFVSLVTDGESTTDQGELLERGERVVTSQVTTVRSDPAVRDRNVVFTQPEGVTGSAVGGPVTADGFSWYEIEYDNSKTGWSPRTKLSVAGAFDIEQRVSPVVDTTVYRRPDRSSVEEGIARMDDAGYVRDGPKLVDGVLFWRVAFNSGLMGWVSETNLSPAPLDAAGGEPPAFDIGQTVQSTVDLNVRQKPDIDSSDIGTASDGETGTVTDGIVSADGYTWWKVAWADAPTGWSVQRYLDDGRGDRPGGTVRQPQSITVDTPIDVRVDISGAELDDAIAGLKPSSPLVGLGDVWVDVQNERDVDAIYQAAHACLESAYGTSAIAQEKNNLYGFDARDVCPAECADSFSSFEDSIRQVMSYVDREYLSSDGRYYVEPT